MKAHSPGAARAAAPAGRWEHYPHQADLGIRGRGATKARAFEQAARALTAAAARLDAVAPRVSLTFRCRGADDETLLFEWLNRLVFEMATRRMLFAEFNVVFEPGGLRARARGEPLDPARHEPGVEIKAATWYDLRVERQPGGEWVAQCVLDV